MPDGIVGANDGFFGNFLLGYNPNADIYINNDNVNIIVKSHFILEEPEWNNQKKQYIY